ncbi:MAG: hypothetical protein SNH35_06830 [Rikenellaceae bacterium]
MKGLIIFVALICVSCSIAPRDFAFERVLSIESPTNDSLTAELLLRNDSADTLTIQSGKIIIQMKRDDLLTLTLSSAVVVPPQGTIQAQSQWHIRRDDPATLYTLQSRPFERYADKITINYTLQLELGRRRKALSHKGLKVSELNINFENLLQ